MTPELRGKRGSYRERLDPSERRSAERVFIGAVAARLAPADREQLANYFRYEAPGHPTWRGYIVDLIEGREVALLDE